MFQHYPLPHMSLLSRFYENKHQNMQTEVTIKSNDFLGGGDPVSHHLNALSP